MEENAIEIVDLQKYYYLFDKDYKIIPWLFTKKGNSGIKKAVDGININIKKGEIIGLVGKNGAGKSTLMKLISGITMPTWGHIKVNGKVGSLINLGAGFNPNMTGRQNIYYKGSIMGMEKSDIDLILDDIIKFADIGKYFDMPLKMYSSGMAARLGFSLAIYSEPDILIVDEVFAVGDKDFRDKSGKKMEEMFKSGKTIIFSSHSEGQIKQFCHRAIYMENGHIIAEGNTNEVLAKYNGISNKKTKEKSPQNKQMLNIAKLNIARTNDIKSININNKIELESIGKDPYIIFKNNINKKNITINIDIIIEFDTNFQIFYTNEENKTFNKENSITKKIYKGTNKINIEIDSLTNINKLRVAPGNKAGKYIINNIIINL